MASDIEARVVSILAGDADAVGELPPMLTLDQQFSMVKRAWAKLDAEWPLSGRAIAAGLGYQTLPKRPPRTCGEAENLGTIAYDPNLPSEWRSFMITHGVTHPELRRRWDPHSHADNWVLSALLLVPPGIIRTLSGWEVVERAPCPPRITQAAINLVRAADRGAVSIFG